VSISLTSLRLNSTWLFPGWDQFIKVTSEIEIALAQRKMAFQIDNYNSFLLSPDDFKRHASVMNLRYLYLLGARCFDIGNPMATSLYGALAT